MSSSTDNINNLAHSLEPINLSDFDCNKESKKQRPSGPKSCLDSACFKNRSRKRLLSGRGFQTVSSLGSSESSSTTSTIYHRKLLQATESYCHPVICRSESPRLKVVISQSVKPERNLNEGKRRRKGKPNYCNTAFLPLLPYMCRLPSPIISIHHTPPCYSYRLPTPSFLDDVDWENSRSNCARLSPQLRHEGTEEDNALVLVALE